MSTSRPRRLVLVVLAALVVLVGVVGAGLAWFFSGDEPAAVDLDTAAAGVAAQAPETEPEAGVAGVDGTWVVDAGSDTFAGFRISEELRSVGSTTAVGRTGSVSGEVVIEGTTLTGADIAVDLTTITTDESRRDDKVQSALETGRFPTATFSLTEPVELGDDDTASVVATGELTIHGVTREVALPLQARLVGETIVVVGSTEVAFSDYGVEVPSSPVVLSVDDVGTVEVQLLLTRSAA
jgi:polyisoprenoid-binding protein YceI